MAQPVLLIVVSDSEQRARFNQALRSSRSHLVFALDGEEGLERFHEVKPDLVLADADAPRLDGKVFFQLVRQAPGGSEVPLVLFGRGLRREEASGEGNSSKPTAAESGVADAVLPYPFERRNLLRELAPLLVYGRSGPAHDGDEALNEPPLPPAAVTAADEEPSSGVDVRTVVSFQNPFYNAEREAASEAENGEPKDRGTADVEPSLGTAESPTPVGRRPEGSERPRGDIVAPEAVSEARTERKRSDVGLDPDAEVRLPADSMARGERETEVRARPQEGHRSEPQGTEPTEALDSERLPSAVSPPSSDDLAPSEPRPRAVRRGLDDSQLGKRLTQRIRTLHSALDEVDYYQLLGVEPGAQDARIHSAWFDLSLEFHPDRFFLLRSGELKEKIYAIFRRLTEAHRVLGDPERRSEYDRSRQISGAPRAAEALRSSNPSVSGSLELTVDGPAAEPFALRAEQAFARGDLQETRFHLHAVLGFEANNASARRALMVVEAQLGPTV